jgi:hypothetical protein
MKINYLINLMPSFILISCVTGSKNVQNARQFQLYSTGAEESPNALWLVDGAGKKVLELDRGDRMEVIGHSWSPRREAAAINIVRGTKVANLVFIGKLNGVFQKINYEEPDFYKSANAVELTPGELWDNMDVEYVLVGWEGDSVFRYRMEMQSEEAGNFIFRCRIDVGSLAPKVVIENISRTKK